MLGEIIADAVEEKANPLLQKFRWRPEVQRGSCERSGAILTGIIRTELQWRCEKRNGQ